MNKKLYFALGIVFLFVGMAAFIAGRMFNREINPLTLFAFRGNGVEMRRSINVIPAEELPTTQPEVTGLFVERQDNTIKLQAKGMGNGGGSHVEIVITSKTIIYRDTTELSGSPSEETQTIQQTVDEGTLDDLNPPAFVTVWGRKSGDRIIAEVLFYSNDVVIQKP